MVTIGLRTNTNVTGKNLLLPDTWEEFATEVINIYGKSTTRSIKYRAPVRTGNLKRAIKFERASGKSKIANILFDTVKAPYLEYANKGIAPNWIPTEFIGQHNESPGARGEFVLSPIWHSGSESIFRNKNFIERGLKSSQGRFQKYVSQGFNKVIKPRGK